MKNLVLILAIIFCVSAVNDATAQLTKKEKKEWKKKKKKTSPEQFKRMYDENSSLKSEVSSLQGQLSSVQGSMGEKDAKIAELTEENRKMEAQVNAAKKAIAQARQEADNTPAASAAPVDDSGVVFKVQIGAFRNKDLSKYFENNPNFGGETDDDGVQKITLGRFRDYWEADTFKKYLREMGVNDAWIVPYKDGTRVAMKDVLEGVVQ
jgi:outer membrane murein-binding lipoprotein Lpp